MPAGAALLYSGKVIPGGGPNGSADQWRVGLHAGFVFRLAPRRGKSPAYNVLEAAKKLPEHAQRMLGFRSFNPPKAARLGMVNYEDAGQLLDRRLSPALGHAR